MFFTAWTYDRARTITWDGVIEKLVSQASA